MTGFAPATFICEDCGYITHRWDLGNAKNVCCVCQWLRDAQNLTDPEREQLRARLNPGRK